MLGMSPEKLLDSFRNGVGSTLSGLALILALGAILGKILEAGGAAEKISSTLVTFFGERRIQWAMMLTGFLVGIPLYYNAGFVILVPLVFSVARRTRLPLLYIAIPMAASLSTTHCFLPPHPGPVVLVNAFKADMGKTLLYGLALALPAVIIAGPLLGAYLQRLHVTVNNLFAIKENAPRSMPGAASSFAVALLPVLLITLSVLADNFIPGNSIAKNTFQFLGDPSIALLLAVLLAIWVFGVHAGHSMETVMKWLNDGIAGIAVILLIITAGGVFKQVLTDSGTGEKIAALSRQWNMPPLLFGWIVTALLRVTIGSATVAGITAAGVVAPLVSSGSVSPELMVLAVGAGSVFGSHINDTGFWMFKEFFRLTLKETFLSWTLMETVISLVGLAGVLLLNSLL